MNETRRWLERFAAALGEQAPRPEDVRRLLKVSREVAHGVERRLAPLTAFVIGIHVGRRLAEGGGADQALQEAAETARGLIPTQPGDGVGDPDDRGNPDDRRDRGDQDDHGVPGH